MNAEASPAPNQQPDRNVPTEVDFDFDENYLRVDGDRPRESNRDNEIRQNEEFGRETLGASKKLQQLIREQTFNMISGADMAKSEAEDSIARVKQSYLTLKKNSQQRKIDKFQQKSRSSIFAFRREKFAQKARWANNRLENTQHQLSKLDKRHGLLIERNDDGEKIKRKRGDAYEKRKKLYIERARELEKKRAKLIEDQLVAKERKRRRKLKQDVKNDNIPKAQRLRSQVEHEHLGHINNFRENVRNQIQIELTKHMDKMEKTIMESNRRWRWHLENTEEDSEENRAIDRLDKAVNGGSEDRENLDRTKVDGAIDDIEDAVDELMGDDPNVVE